MSKRGGEGIAVRCDAVRFRQKRETRNADRRPTQACGLWTTLLVLVDVRLRRCLGKHPGRQGLGSLAPPRRDTAPKGFGSLVDCMAPTTRAHEAGEVSNIIIEPSFR
jgi:hypothetical protein